MIFKCKNCGANAIYSPEKKKMYCPYCDSEDSEEIAPGEGMNFCINCGGELKPGDYMSAVKCEHCGSYIVFEERIQGQYEPHLILPFKVGKKQAQDIIRKEFGKKAFIPSDFLSEAKMSEMEGMYVPFFMYDFACDYKMTGTGHKVRVWRTGNTEYTETSIFNFEREMDIDFDKIPVDSSIAMPDDTMDLMEPYDYKELENFQAKYMSGFLGEKYNMPVAELEPRAIAKARKDADYLMNSTLSEYSSVTNRMPHVDMTTKANDYTLLPVWSYSYSYKGKDYPFKLNGQTGKMVGNAPFSMAKVWGYGATVLCGTFAILTLINLILGVL